MLMLVNRETFIKKRNLFYLFYIKKKAIAILNIFNFKMSILFISSLILYLKIKLFYKV